MTSTDLEARPLCRAFVLRQTERSVRENRYMIRFEIHRDTDPTGASGTGVVADGIRLADGRAIVRWRGERSSVVFWARFDDAVAIHGHDGRTRFVNTSEVPEVERPGVLAAAHGAQLALGMVFAGPCDELHPDGVRCVQPAGHLAWPSFGGHIDATGGAWFPVQAYPHADPVASE